jgi:hypothetical protein
VPTTLLGLVLFVTLLAPGLCFFLARDALRPQRELSAFRETAVVVFVGLACDLSVLLGFAFIRRVAPSLTPDVHLFLLRTNRYSIRHVAFVSWWGVGLLAAACAIGFLAGRMKTVRVPVLHAKWPPFSLRKLELGPIRFESAWYKLFHGHEDEIVYCGCTLEDGTWVGGYLKSYSTEVQETADRELILVAPIRLRPAEMDTAVGFDTSAFVVSARRLMFLDVQYLEEGADLWEIERALDEANRQEQQGPEQSEGPTQ